LGFTFQLLRRRHTGKFGFHITPTFHEFSEVISGGFRGSNANLEKITDVSYLPGNGPLPTRNGKDDVPGLARSVKETSR
jgi:hypothetical protein